MSFAPMHGRLEFRLLADFLQEDRQKAELDAQFATLTERAGQLEAQQAVLAVMRVKLDRTRQDAERVEWSERYDVWKIHPLVDWDAKRVDAYIHVNEIPYNPLHDAGYPSIGCIPCTRPVSRGEDERAGRWADADKIECGIHDKS